MFNMGVERKADGQVDNERERERAREQERQRGDDNNINDIDDDW